MEKGGVDGWVMSQGLMEAKYLPDAAVVVEEMGRKNMKNVRYTVELKGKKIDTTQFGRKNILFHGPQHSTRQYFYMVSTRHQGP